MVKWKYKGPMSASAALLRRLAGPTLATQTSTATSILFLIAFLAVGMASMSSFRSQLLNVMVAEQNTLVERISDNLDQKLRSLQQALTLSASEIGEQDLATSDAAQRYLDANTGLFAAFDRSVFLFSVDGKLVAERPFRPNRRGMDASWRTYIRDTVSTRQSVISDPFVSNVGDANMVLVITAPVFSKDGRLVAILTGSLGLTNPGMLGNVAQTVIGRTGFLYIVTAEGKLIMHPERERLSKPAFARSTNELFDRALNGFEGTEEIVEPISGAALVSYKRVPASNWVIGARYPKSEAFAAVDGLVRHFIVFLLVACLVVVGAIWTLTRYLMRPLVRLTRHFTSYGARNEPLAPLYSGMGSGEIHALTIAFNDLTTRLQEREEALLETMQRFQLIAENATDLITKQTPAGVITYASPVSISMLGIPHTEMLGHSLLEFVHPEDFSVVRTAFDEAVATKLLRTVIYRVRNSSQDYLWFETTLRLMVGATGESTTEILCLSRNISERKQMEQRLYDLARTDHLTTLPNRFLLEERFTLARTQARRESLSFALLMVDIDRFKNINDTLGHSMGDALLKVAASRLAMCIRECDTLARWGGDEFMMLLPGLHDVVTAQDIAARCLATLKQPFVVEGHVLHITASIGISISPSTTIESELMLRNADTAMYRAKARGGDCTMTYDSEMSAGAHSRLSMENALFQAVERHELLLHYQPLISAKTGRLVGVEALLRWQHPQLGLVSPGQFIPIAEDTGLITVMGEWVLHTACAQMTEWYAQGLPPIPISVNLSSRQFRDEGLAQVIKTVLHDTGLAPELLELELTESLLMDDVGRSKQSLAELKALGVTIALDDFGTGYSSLSYLKGFQVDTLKIDRAFTAELLTSEANASIVRATIGLAKGLNLRTVAEGVETRAQAAFLTEHGCDVLQGFLFAKPMPQEAFLSFALASHTYLLAKRSS